MITHLSGTTLFVNDRFAVVDVNGVGYKVHTTLDALRTLKGALNTRATLWIHTIVREDALDLYGFLEREELEFFEMLINVSGIGPKSALGILSIAGVPHLKEAIAGGNAAALTKVSGIGAKSAQKIILELRDKLGGIEGGADGGTLHEEHEAVLGLVALGYAERDAREALKSVPPDIKGTSTRIKQALKQLGR